VRAASLAATAAILALTGCGSSSAPRHQIHLTPLERRGKTVFITTCGICHQLADAGTDGVVGPALDRPWLASRVRQTIAEGPGVMPAGLVTGREAAAVAAYVAAATAQH
jgi:mono/diheme cytochrome c family protein